MESYPGGDVSRVSLQTWRAGIWAGEGRWSLQLKAEAVGYECDGPQDMWRTGDESESG